MAKESSYYRNFPSGWHTNHNPLDAPIDRGEDAAFGGANMVHTERITWKKRPGLSIYHDGSFLSNQVMLHHFSYDAGNEDIRLIVALANGVISDMEPTSALTIFTQNEALEHPWFASVGNVLYAANGVDTSGHFKRIGVGDTKVWGIPAPEAPITHNAPGVGGSPGMRVRIGWRYTYVYRDDTDGHISSAAPLSTTTNNFNGKDITITYTGTSHARVSHIDIYRTKDGGSTLFWHSTIVNPGAITGNFVEETPDADLNELLAAPTEDSNDEPPVGLRYIIQHQDRLWGAVDNLVYFSAHDADGVVNGIREECWAPQNVFTFPRKVKAFLSNTEGLIVFDGIDTHIIRGLNKFDFDPDILWSRIGVQSQHCVASDGSLMYMYTSDQQVLRVSDRVEDISAALSEADLSTFDPMTSYMALHRSGTKSALYLCNNVNTTDNKIWRHGLATGTWSLPWQYDATRYIGAIASVQTSSSSFSLLFSPVLGLAGQQWYVNESVATDVGVPYIPYIIFGDSVIGGPGEIAYLQEIFTESIGTPTKVSFVLQDVDNDAFLDINNSVDDPPLWPSADNFVSKRWFAMQIGTPDRLAGRHLKCKITFPSDALFSELLGLGLMFDRRDDSAYGG